MDGYRGDWIPQGDGTKQALGSPPRDQLSPKERGGPPPPIPEDHVAHIPRLCSELESSFQNRVHYLCQLERAQDSP